MKSELDWCVISEQDMSGVRANSRKLPDDEQRKVALEESKPGLKSRRGELF
jgi:hypothetical protein